MEKQPKPNTEQKRFSEPSVEQSPAIKEIMEKIEKAFPDVRVLKQRYGTQFWYGQDWTVDVLDIRTANELIERLFGGVEGMEKEYGSKLARVGNFLVISDGDYHPDLRKTKGDFGDKVVEIVESVKE